MNFTMNATTGAWLCISNTAHCHIAPHFVPLACHISMNSHISGMGGSTKGLLHRPTTVHALNSTVSPAEGDLTSSNSGPAEFKPRVGMASQQGPREEMEDMTQVIDAQCGFLFATVYDGHAGRTAAEYMHQNLYKVFSSMLQLNNLQLECSLEDSDEGLCCPIEMHSVLVSSYRQADKDLLQWLQSLKGDAANSGCTATTVLVRQDRVIVANVGDSRAILSRNGTAIDLSTEHRVYGRGPSVDTEVSRVEAAGGWIDDGRVCGVLAVSRAFGDQDFKGAGLKRMLARGIEEGMWDASFAASARFSADPVTAEPDVLEMAIQPEDEFVLVATDGLWDVVKSQEVVNFVRGELRKGRGVQETAEWLTSVALKRYTADNVAVVLIDLKGEEGWSAIKPAPKKLFGLF